MATMMVLAATGMLVTIAQEVQLNIYPSTRTIVTSSATSAIVTYLVMLSSTEKGLLCALAQNVSIKWRIITM